ncbi:MAG TPA: hypothetical protein VKT30_08685 [Caulobacteraceae bacterium]|nr:hypothetical protein [Caulobacteraceae bacterium]
MRALLLALVGFFALAGSALAAPETASPTDDHAVTLSPVALPVVADGQVVNYVFVTAKVMLNPHADEFALRDKEPFFRDALVRAAYRTPFVIPTDYNHVDEAKLKAALFRASSAIAGPGAVRGVVVVSQTAQHFVRAPHSAPF